MTGQELRNIIDSVIQGLQDNEQAMTPDMINTIESAVATIRNNTTYQSVIAAALGKNILMVPQILDSVEKFMAIEKSLILDGNGEKYINLLQQVENKSYFGISLLDIIARLI